MKKIRLMIVDDHDLVRTGLRHILSQNDEFEVVADAASGEQALKQIREVQPDIVLLDINLPGLSGFEVCDRIHKHHKNVRVIILTAHSQQPYPSRLLEAGASGFLTKASEADELQTAIRSVARGERFLGAEIAQQMALAMLPGSANSPFEALSAREMEVTLMLGQGMSINTIGETLNLSPKTVSTYKYRIFEKLEIDNEVALLRMAMKHGLIESEQG